jgi:hypothetical protein
MGQQRVKLVVFFQLFKCLFNVFFSFKNSVGVIVGSAVVGRDADAGFKSV